MNNIFLASRNNQNSALMKGSQIITYSATYRPLWLKLMNFVCQPYSKIKSAVGEIKITQRQSCVGFGRWTREIRWDKCASTNYVIKIYYIYWAKKSKR